MELYFLCSHQNLRIHSAIVNIQWLRQFLWVGLATLHSERVCLSGTKILPRIFCPLWCLVFAVLVKPGTKIMMKIHGVPMLFVLTLFNPFHKLLDQFQVLYLASLFALLKVILLLLICFLSEFSCHDHHTTSFSLSVYDTEDPSDFFCSHSTGSRKPSSRSLSQRHECLWACTASTFDAYIFRMILWAWMTTQPIIYKTLMFPCLIFHPDVGFPIALHLHVTLARGREWSCKLIFRHREKKLCSCLILLLWSSKSDFGSEQEGNSRFCVVFCVQSGVISWTNSSWTRSPWDLPPPWPFQDS